MFARKKLLCAIKQLDEALEHQTMLYNKHKRALSSRLSEHKIMLALTLATGLWIAFKIDGTSPWCRLRQSGQTARKIMRGIEIFLI